MQFTNEELRTIESALFLAKGNWYQDYAYGLLDEVEVVTYENWSRLLDKLNEREVA